MKERNSKRTGDLMDNEIDGFSLTQEDMADNVTFSDSPSRTENEVFNVTSLRCPPQEKPTRASQFSLKGAKKRVKQSSTAKSHDDFKSSLNVDNLMGLLADRVLDSHPAAENMPPVKSFEGTIVSSHATVSSDVTIAVKSSEFKAPVQFIADFTQLSEDDMRRLDEQISQQLQKPPIPTTVDLAPTRPHISNHAAPPYPSATAKSSIFQKHFQTHVQVRRSELKGSHSSVSDTPTNHVLAGSMEKILLPMQQQIVKPAGALVNGFSCSQAVRNDNHHEQQIQNISTSQHCQSGNIVSGCTSAASTSGFNKLAPVVQKMSSASCTVAATQPVADFDTEVVSDDFFAELERLEQSALAASSVSTIHAAVSTLYAAPVSSGPATLNPAISNRSQPSGRGNSSVIGAEWPKLPKLPVSYSNNTSVFEHVSQPALISTVTTAAHGTQSPEPLQCSTLVLSLRLIALDVTDDPARRVKSIRAFQQGASDSTEMFRRNSVDLFVTVEACDDWYDSEIVGGDIFHAVDLGDINEQPHDMTVRPRPTIFRSSQLVVVNSQHGLLVLHPDVLISPTKVSESCSCVRRGVIQDKVRSFGGSSSAAVMGNLKHAFIEMMTEKVLDVISSLSSKGSGPVSIGQVRGAVLQKDVDAAIRVCKTGHLEELYAYGFNDEGITVDLASMLEPVLQWVHRAYCSGVQSLSSRSSINHTSVVRTNSVGNGNFSSTPNAQFSRTSTFPSAQHGVEVLDGESNYYVTALESAEETVHCPVLGIKGQIDMVARAKLYSIRSSSQRDECEELLLPIEFKTGKWKPSTVIGHRAQVMLYILMLMVKERCSVEKKLRVPNHGLIMYIGEAETKVDLVKPCWAEIIALVASRNKLAGLIRDSMDVSSKPLPNLLQRLNDCQYCYQAAQCMTYHASVENGSAASSGVPDLFRFVVKDLSPAHLQYLRHWERLIDMESFATNNAQNFAWTMSSGARESKGEKCIGGLKLHSYQKVVDGNNGSDSFLLVFVTKCKSDAQNATVDLGFLDRNVAEGDRMFVSVEGDEKHSAQLIALADKTLDLRLSTNGSNGISNSTVDIEDCGLKRPAFGPASKSVMFTEANICSGSVVKVTPQEIHVNFTSKPKRVLELGGLLEVAGRQGNAAVRQWSFRLDKDEIAINISTMRSNLLSLFVEPYSPNNFLLEQNNKRQSCQSDEATGRPSDRFLAIRRLRELIVDLRAPVFRTPSVLVLDKDEICLFSPPHMSRETFKNCLAMLDTYIRNGNSNLSINALNGQPPQSVSCVSKGPAGELTVFGGLVVYPGCNPIQLFHEFVQLNHGQQEAIRKILMADDYALLLGLPGTGKTSTISLAIRILLAKGQKVLLTSFTHSAVDNLLLKLVESGLSPQQVVRIGAASYVHKDTADFILDAKRLASIEELTAKVNHTRLVACTVLTASRNVLLKHFALDCCVMDEAGQITQPASLGAILSVQRFVLVGDDYQLPPLVVSQEAQTQGMDVSLFKRLLEAHPEAVSCLTAQYRMNEDIMSVCNTLIYEHRMLCASETVAKARLRVSNRPMFSTRNDDWLSLCLDPNLSVVLLDTDQVLPTIDRRGTLPFAAVTSTVRRVEQQQSTLQSVSNPIEAEIVRTVVWGLQRYGVSVKDIGVISPFRAQVELIKSTLADVYVDSHTTNGEKTKESRDVDRDECDVSTVDKFQGRDMDVIVLSMVKSSQEGKDSIGNLLRDWRRINVAVTRAKVKLVIVGSVTVMQQVPVLSSLTSLARERNWILRLPPNANQLYDMSHTASQLSGATIAQHQPVSLLHGGVLAGLRLPVAPVPSTSELTAKSWLPFGIGNI